MSHPSQIQGVIGIKTKYLTIGLVVVCAVALGFVTSSLLNKSHTSSPSTTNNQNKTDASSTNNTVPSNAPTDNSTSPSTGSSNAAQTISSSQQAEAVVSGLYATQMAKNAKLTVRFDHEDTSNGQKVYVIHVFDNEPSHVATIAWVDVRADGMVQNDVFRNGWVAPSQYQS